MRTLPIIVLALILAGCTRWSMDRHLNNAYREYARGDCERVMLELSQVERKSRSRRYVQPEVSLLRGQCLERQSLFVDAAETYRFILAQFPGSEYAYRARARLETLRHLGRIDPALTRPAPL
ncbi:tetratricopeptide repeat protein [Zestomonas thermotolerans]|uniref:tetratricopeptide repeat protein n=1 Tax=Zestomonas thermotolerans TaxID=157784 RepID=UPI0023F4DCFE|nr:tetratricopeptide repeat protein [Pseudomonas thermotolerans]